MCPELHFTSYDFGKRLLTSPEEVPGYVDSIEYQPKFAVALFTNLD